MLQSIQTVTGTIALAKAIKRLVTQNGETFWTAPIGYGGIPEVVISKLSDRGFHFIRNGNKEGLVWSKGRK